MKISELPELLTLSGGEYLPIIYDNRTYKIAASLLTTTSAAPPPPPPTGPDVPPSSPNALDDEFTGSALSTSWMWTNQATAIASIADGKLNLSRANSGGGDSFSYIHKTPPTAPWSMTAKIKILGSDFGLATQGLIVGNPNGRHITFNSGWTGSSRRIEIFRFNSPTSYNSQAYSRAPIGELGGKTQAYYARIFGENSQLKFFLSSDGITFQLLYTENFSTFLTSVTKIGFDVGAQNGDASVDVEWARFNWAFS